MNDSAQQLNLKYDQLTIEFDMTSQQSKEIESQLRKQENSVKEVQDELEEKRALVADLEDQLSQKSI